MTAHCLDTEYRLPVISVIVWRSANASASRDPLRRDLWQGAQPSQRSDEELRPTRRLRGERTADGRRMRDIDSLDVGQINSRQRILVASSRETHGRAGWVLVLPKSRPGLPCLCLCFSNLILFRYLPATCYKGDPGGGAKTWLQAASKRRLVGQGPGHPGPSPAP